jgi:hypothetical protein
VIIDQHFKAEIGHEAILHRPQPPYNTDQSCVDEYTGLGLTDAHPPIATAAREQSGRRTQVHRVD